MHRIAFDGKALANIQTRIQAFIDNDEAQEMPALILIKKLGKKGRAYLGEALTLR